MIYGTLLFTKSTTMKKILFALVAATLMFSGCNKEDDDKNGKDKGLQVKKEQWAFVLNYTATWCGPCGSSGAPVILACGATPRALAVKAHASNDPMHVASYYSQFGQQRPSGGGIPSFWVNDIKTTTGGTKSTMEDELKKMPVAGLAIESTREGTNFKVKVKGQFFSAQAGEYFLSVFLLEDGIDGSASAGAYKQNGTSDPAYKHNYVFRTAATTDLYGESVLTSPAENAVFEKEYTIAVDPAWQMTVYPVAILWKKDTSGATPHYKFINAIK